MKISQQSNMYIYRPSAGLCGDLGALPLVETFSLESSILYNYFLIVRWLRIAWRHV